MILLVSALALRPGYAEAVEEATRREWRFVGGMEAARQQVREACPEVVVLDAGLLEAQPEEVEALLAEAPSAVPVFPILAVCGPDRLVSEVRAALRRREEEMRRAENSARSEFSKRLRDSVTAFLLQCELALQGQASREEVNAKIRMLQGLALQMRERLG
jgi:hypothetical protein